MEGMREAAGMTWEGGGGLSGFKKPPPQALRLGEGVDGGGGESDSFGSPAAPLRRASKAAAAAGLRPTRLGR